MRGSAKVAFGDSQTTDEALVELDGQDLAVGPLVWKMA